MDHKSWAVIYERILELRKLLEGDSEVENLEDWRMNTFTLIYNIYCRNPLTSVSAQNLYEIYKESFKDYMPLVLKYLKNKDGEVLLRELLKRWEKHNVMVEEISKCFRILDCFFVKGNRLLPLREAGLMSFRSHVYHEIKASVKNAVFNLINNEREGEQIDSVLMKQVSNFFLEIGIDDFEAAMLENTRAYYSRKAAFWISVDSCQEYMKRAEDCWEREKDRAAHYLHPSSEPKLLGIVQNELLLNYKTQLLENEQSGCQILLRENNVHDLSRIYRLFSKIPNGLEPIANKFRQHLAMEGTTLIRQAEEDAVSHKTERRDILSMHQDALVRKVIELQDKYVEYIEDTFQNDRIFCNALKESLERICDSKVEGSTFAEILALYLHNLLQKGGIEKLRDSNTDIEKAMELVEYICDKDLFAEFCRRNLAIRFLFDQSVTLSAEDSIIAKIKQQCGEQYTLNMEGMLKDMKLAEEGSDSRFVAYLQSQNMDLGIELNVKLLKAEFWPTYEFSQLNLPSEIARSIEVFNRYYSSTETKDRKLRWMYSLGTCYINGRFEAMTVDMKVTTYQAVVLLLFNDNENLSYANIKSQLNMRDEDLARVLQSLACSKYKILLKQPNTDTIDTADIFEVNHNFTNKLKRIHLSNPAVDYEKKKATEVVDNDRTVAIDGSIVRAMKRKRVLKQSDLVKDCIEDLARKMFKPDIEVIKREIESLMKQGFLEQDTKKSDRLKYVP